MRRINKKREHFDLFPFMGFESREFSRKVFWIDAEIGG